MIRVVTLDEYDPKAIEKLCKALYASFGVGSEHTGETPLPSGLGDPVDGHQLLERVPKVRAYQDDKLLYLTPKKLKDRKLATGTAPTQGVARYGGDRAVISTSVVKDLEEGLKLVSRHALHQLGHLWELHHCLDPRCSMYPPWALSFANGDAIFCTYCREKSEQQLRLAKS